MGRILLIVIGLLIYGSLYPFAFHARHLPASPLWMLLHAWPTVLERYGLIDAALNVLIYVPVGLFGTLWLRGNRVLPVLIAFSLSAGMELLQLYDLSRDSSALDVVLNTSGAVLGVWLARVYGRRIARLMADARATLRPTPALLLLCFWVGYQTFPLIPNLRISPVLMKAAHLYHPGPFSVLQAIGTAVDWLSVARLLEETGFGGGAFSALLLLIPAKLLIAGRTFTWPELAGALCAWLVWNGGLARLKGRTGLVAGMAAAVILMRGWSPYHWQSAGAAFSWKPFGGFLESGRGWSGIVFFDKSFLYGTAIWLFTRAGCSAAAAGGVVVALLAVMEAVQMHLPGRTPEITDPLYAAILAVVLKLLDSADRAARRYNAISPHAHSC